MRANQEEVMTQLFFGQSRWRETAVFGKSLFAASLKLLCRLVII